MAIIKKRLYNRTDLEFNPDNHRFTVNGESGVLSVSGISNILDKPFLKFWSVKLMAEHLEDVLEKTGKINLYDIENGKRKHTERFNEAGNIGTEVHKWAEEYIRGKIKTKIPDNEKIQAGIKAFLKWVKKHEVNFLNSEEIIYSQKHHYAGILDCIAEIQGKLTLIDFKTSNGIYTETRYQIAGYAMAWEEMTGDKIQKRVIARFDKNTGEFEHLVIHKKDFEKDNEAFLACLALRRREQDLKG